MEPIAVHDRAYLRARLHEETHRAARHGHPFALLVFEAVPSAVDGLPVRQKVAHALHALAQTVRGGDVIAAIEEDVLGVLLIETGPVEARDALFRFRSVVAREAGTWHAATYCYPEHRDALAELEFLRAA